MKSLLIDTCMGFWALPRMGSTVRGVSSLAAASGLASRGSGGRSSVSGVVATVFGNTGFLGRYVVNQLGRIGSQVIVPYRGDELASRHLKLMGDLGQIVPRPFELRDEQSIHDSVQNSNVVINLMGKHYETMYYKFNDVHVDGAKRVAQISKDAGVDHFIHISTLPPKKECASPWYETKVKGEQAVKEVYPDATIIRPATLWGSSDRLLTRMAADIYNMPYLPLVDDGRAKIQPVWVNDVASVIAAASRDTEGYAGRTFELAGPDVLTIKDIWDFVITSTRQTATFLPVPQIFFSLALRVLGRRIPLVNPSPRYTVDDFLMECSDRLLDESKKGVRRFDDLDVVALHMTGDMGAEVLRRFRKGGDRSSLFYVD